MRHRTWIAALLLFAGPLAPVTACQAEPAFQFYTEEYPPITFSRDGEPAGLGTEVVQEILRRADLQASIEVVPWARGYSNATTLPRVGLFVTTRTAEREPLFKWVGPISATRGSLYVLAASGVRPTNLQEARDLENIAVPRSWYLHQILLGQDFKNLQLVPNPLAAMKILISRHVQAIALDDVTLEMSSHEAGVPVSIFEPVLPIAEALQFLAFSLDTPDDVVQRCQKTLDEMKADGTFARIYRRWLPAAVPP